MTRRKRTPSPVSAITPQKRVAFEIPTSLQHFSNISRSLATNTSPQLNMSTGIVANDVQANTPRVIQPAPSAQLSSQPSPSSARPAQQRTVGAIFIPQKRAFPDAQPWPQPIPRPQARSAISLTGPSAQAPGPAPETPPSASPWPQTRTSTSSNSVEPPPAEPALQPGETPCIDTHPNLVAALVAQKRAESEATGRRGRLARAQSSYIRSQSPGSRLKHEMRIQASYLITIRPERPRRPRRAPRPPVITSPAQPTITTPTQPAITTPTPIAFNSAPEASKPVSAEENTEHQKEGKTPNDAHRDGDDSLFGSDLSSPIAEFLERATDDVGLGKDGHETTRPSTAASNHPSQNVPPIQTNEVAEVTPPDNPSEAPEPSEPPEPPEPPDGTPVPSLSSDKPNPTPAMPQVSSPKDAPLQNSPPVVQQQQTPSSQPTAVRMQPKPPPQIRPPTYQNISPYYNFPPNGPYWPVMPNHATPPPSAPRASSYAPSPPMPYPPYAIPVMVPYVAAPNQIPSPIATYGNTIGSRQAATNGQRSGSTNLGFVSAADMVAGINVKFKNSTQQNFSVPKRY